MVALQFRLSFLLVLVTVGYCQTIDTEDLKEKIEESLDDKENIKNVVKVLGLDMSNFGAEDTDEKLCNLIKASSPELIGLQDLQISQLIKLQNCFGRIKHCRVSKVNTKGRKKRSRRTTRCSGYEIVAAGSSNSDETTFFNPIIFKHKRGLRSLGPNGTFWLSETPDKPFTKLEDASGHGICTWAKLRFAVREGVPKQNVTTGNAFFETLYSVLKKKERKHKRNTKWVDFYFANTRFDENVDVAMQQFDIFYDYLRANVLNDSPDVPIVLTVGSDSNVAEKLAEAFSSRTFNNAITESRQTYNDNPSSKSTTFILQSDLVNLIAVKSLEDLESQFTAILF